MQIMNSNKGMFFCIYARSLTLGLVIIHHSVFPLVYTLLLPSPMTQTCSDPIPYTFI